MKGFPNREEGDCDELRLVAVYAEAGPEGLFHDVKWNLLVEGRSGDCVRLYFVVV